MAPLILEGNTLGEKHRFYNKLVDEGYEPVNPDDGDDVQVLLKIDIASKKRDVNYIVEMLKSEDQLYVSKAIKRSTWLITDPQYAHIINPQHLYTQLRPQMTSKAFNKLMLSVRLNLRDHKRVEEFYNYIQEQQPQTAYKWLQHCSLEFMTKEVIKSGGDIPHRLLLRLFERSFPLFEEYSIKESHVYEYAITNIKKYHFLSTKYTNEFLDFLMNLKYGFYGSFNVKCTKILMRKCYEKILDNFEIYGKHIHLPTFAKYLNKKKNVEEFLLQQAKNKNINSWLFSFEHIQNFIKFIPTEIRYDFVKKYYIDREMLKDEKKYFSEEELDFTQRIMKCNISVSRNTNLYQWYHFAPFEIALNELKKLIRVESSPTTRNVMFQILVNCCGRKPQHLHALLQYYVDKHINEPFKFKSQFVNYFISRVDTHSLDDNTWKLLNQLFHSMEVYIPSENNVQSFIKSILIRSIIRKEKIPMIIRQKFVFDTLKTTQNKLRTQQEKEAVFEFLYSIIIEKYIKLNLSVKEEFIEAVSSCEVLLKLAHDWNKDLNGEAVEFIRKLIEINRENKWDHNLSQLYNINKSCRITLFEESISLHPSDSVCINALKHDPGLFSRYKTAVEMMCCNNTVTLRHVLGKIRVYWAGSLAENWKITYLAGLEQSNGHKALIIGFCMLMSHNELKDLLKKYAPTETKIEWDGTDQRALSIRKQLAMNIHKARPLMAIGEVLPYAKGDYLQFAVPSVNAILSQLSTEKCRHIIPILLDVPVSLKKFGVCCAIKKLNSDELLPMLTNIWNSNKNPSIRAVLFTQTFSILCQESNLKNAKYTWDLLCTFIDKLTPDENRIIYRRLSNVSKVPKHLKPQFFMKAYIFLNSLPAKCNCEEFYQALQHEALELMDSLDDDFVVNILLKDVSRKMKESPNTYKESRLISSFILYVKDEDMQIRRYEKSIVPLLEEFLPLWENVNDDSFVTKNHINNLFEKLFTNIYTFTFKKKTPIPAKAFEMMLTVLENSLSYQKDYVFLTTWKLATAFVQVMKEKSTDLFKDGSIDNITDSSAREKLFEDVHNLIAPSFVGLCVKYLKEDQKRFGQSIYLLFLAALRKLFSEYIDSDMCNASHILTYALCFIQYHDEKEIWIISSLLLQDQLYEFKSDSYKQKFEKIRDIVNMKASDELKIHFNSVFTKIVPFVLTSPPSEKIK